MKKVTGKIILVDDQVYEKHLLKDALYEKDWDIEVEYFNNAKDALKHLKKNADEIFLIISDMNMPGMSGMDFKKTIDSDDFLRQKSIPFIFVSNDPDREKMFEAYHYRVQGYFSKPDTVEKQADMLEIIVQYWISCSHPMKDDITTENPEKFAN